MTNRRDHLDLRARDLRERSIALTLQALQLQQRAERAIGAADSAVGEAERLRRSSAALRGSIVDYAAALRELGQSPERAAENIRSIADDAFEALRPAQAASREEREVLVSKLVAWAMAAYAA